MSNSRLIFSSVVVAGLLGSPLGAQDPRPILRQQLAAVKESLLKNQQQLKQYSWTETIVASFNGEEKSRQQEECHYDADGRLVKTPLGAGPESGEAAKKLDEWKDYLESAASLIGHYVPPDPARINTAFESGRAALSLNATSSSTTIEDYYRAGDLAVLTFSQGQIRSVTVRSYLGDPSDVVTLNVTFQPLADGTNYMAESVLDGLAKQIHIRVTNFDHSKPAAQ